MRPLPRCLLPLPLPLLLLLGLLLALPLAAGEPAALPPPPEPLPPGLTDQQLLDIELARAAMAEAVANPAPFLEALALDAAGNPLPHGGGGGAGGGAGSEDAPQLAAAYATDLLMGAMSGDAALVREALAHGASLAAADAQGRAPLALAAMNGRAELVRELLRLGAAREARDASGLTAAKLVALLREESEEEGDAPRAALLAGAAAVLDEEPL